MFIRGKVFGTVSSMRSDVLSQISLGFAQNTNVEHIRDGVLHLIFTIRSGHHRNPLGSTYHFYNIVTGWPSAGKVCILASLDWFLSSLASRHKFTIVRMLLHQPPNL